MSDNHLEVYRALRESQTRYAYFLLAAAGAAIGLVVSQTQTATLQWAQIPLAIAVAMWGLSFFVDADTWPTSVRLSTQTRIY
jgi:hypothetical protein